MTVRFGGVMPLDDMNVTLDVGINGLIGPNGAGKTTFFNVLSGFVRPTARHRDRVRRRPAGDGELPACALGAAAHVPDRAGDRRAVGVRERPARPRALREPDVEPPRRRRRRPSSSSGCGSVINRPRRHPRRCGAPARRSGPRRRRHPRLVLLDEPAAGLPDDETVALGEVIMQIPDVTGALGRSWSTTTCRSSATTCCARHRARLRSHPRRRTDRRDVLNDPTVMAAYLGTEEVV